MATEGGAATTPYRDRIGVRQPGKAADLILFDWDAITYPYLSEDTPVIDALVQRAASGHVTLVMIGDEVVFHNGHFPRINRDSILEALAQSMRRPLTQVEERNRELGLGLLEHARRFYDGYISERGRDPFYQSNSRV
jgi:hypothetical protein